MKPSPMWVPLICLAALGASPLPAPATRPAAVDAVTLEGEVRAIAAKCVATTVGFVHSKGDGPFAETSSGSGVIVTPDGLVLTAGHVIDKPGTDLTVRFTDGRVFHGVAVGVDHLADTGLARITDPAPAGGWPFSPMAPADSARPGDWVVATGNAGSIVVGRDPPLRLGRVTATDPGVLRTNCALEPGDSGGPVFDLAGRVIGINSRIAESQLPALAKEYMSLHAPVGVFAAQWSELLGGMNAHPDVNLDTGGRRRRPGSGQMGRFRRALAALVAAKDPEAMKLLSDARAQGARLALPPEKMDALIRRADALGSATTRPTTAPAPAPGSVATTAPTPTTRPALARADRSTTGPAGPAVATTQPAERGVPLAMRPRIKESLRASLLRQFPTATVTDALLDRILDRSSIDPVTHQLKINPDVSDLKAMGLTDQAIVTAAGGRAAGSRSAAAWGKTSLQTLSLFAPALASAGDCVAEVRSADGTTVLMATIVDPDGWVVTKASDLPAHPVVVLPDGRSMRAAVIGKDRATDLAVLRVAARGLSAARLDAGPAPLGEWVCCPTADPNQPAVGLVSVVARPIAVDAPAFVGQRKIMLGVQFAGDTCEVDRVLPDMPAAAAGVKAGDEVVMLQGKPVSQATDFIARMKDAKAGQTVAITVRRAGKPVDLKLVLGTARATTQLVESLGNTDQYAGGKLSRRRTDFPEAIETDSAVWADQCGGPVVNLNGEAIGVTIARYDRTCTLVLPAELVEQAVARVRASLKF